MQSEKFYKHIYFPQVTLGASNLILEPCI